MGKLVRWGVVGAGRIARQFIEDSVYAPNANVCAIASRSKEAANSFAEQYQLEFAFDSYQGLFESDCVDAIYIATPHSHHKTQAVAALRAGKSVLVEKPIVTSPAELAELIAVAKENDQFLAEAMWTYHLPAIRKAMDWLNQGRIGTLKHLKADFGYPQLPFDASRREYNAELGGGCLLEMGVYPIALDWLVNQRQPDSISCIAKRAPNGVEDDLSWITSNNDVVSALSTSFRARFRNGATLVGDAGWIDIPDFFRASEALYYRLDYPADDHFVDSRHGHGFEYQIDNISRDILAGLKESAEVPLSASSAIQEYVQGLFTEISE